jgi:hypothetical protein
LDCAPPEPFKENAPLLPIAEIKMLAGLKSPCKQFKQAENRKKTQVCREQETKWEIPMKCSKRSNSNTTGQTTT